MVRLRVKKGDTVKVLRGKDRGRTGKVMQVMPQQGVLLVEGLQMVQKHVKSRQQGGKTQRVAVASPIPVAKVQLVCPKCKAATRVTVVRRDGHRERLCKKCSEVLL